MTDRELRKLRRQELLEILFSLRSELDKVKLENEALKKQLEEKNAFDEDTAALMRRISEQVGRLYADRFGNESAADEDEKGSDTGGGNLQ